MFSWRLGRFWLLPCNNSHAVADFCIEVGDKVELVGRVADFFVVVGEGLFDKAPESKNTTNMLRFYSNQNCNEGNSRMFHFLAKK